MPRGHRPTATCPLRTTGNARPAGQGDRHGLQLRQRNITQFGAAPAEVTETEEQAAFRIELRQQPGRLCVQCEELHDQRVIDFAAAVAPVIGNEPFPERGIIFNSNSRVIFGFTKNLSFPRSIALCAYGNSKPPLQTIIIHRDGGTLLRRARTKRWQFAWRRVGCRTTWSMRSTQRCFGQVLKVSALSGKLCAPRRAKRYNRTLGTTWISRRANCTREIQDRPVDIDRLVAANEPMRGFL